MAWTGKLLGAIFGYLAGGWIGAIVGLLLGHFFDQARSKLGRAVGEASRVQQVFFRTTFSVMGYVAKADGRVSQAEIQAAETVMRHMDLSGEQRRAAIEYFSQGKQADFNLDSALAEFRQACGRQPLLSRMFLEIQLRAALADGRVDAAEHQAMVRIARALGLSEADVARLEAMLSGDFRQHAHAEAQSPDSLEHSYQVLGVNRTASNDEIKKAYRRLISQHHPDKLVSQGLPEQMLRMAKEKTQEISKAYDTIKQARGMR